MDNYESLTLQSLIRAAFRTTPANEAHNWVITDTEKGQWVYNNENLKLYKRSEVIEEMEHDTMREYIVEQLQHYGVTTRQINFMQS